MNIIILIRPIIQTIFGIILISLATAEKNLPWEYRLPFMGVGVGMILLGWLIFRRDWNKKRKRVSDDI